MAPEVHKPGLPTLHHMNHAQSQRVLWLLEEMGIEYNLVLHRRNEQTQRAPPELKAIHPLGKAPVLVTKDGMAIAETSAIMTYLLRTYDTEGKFTSKDWLLDEQVVSFAGTSLGTSTMVILLFEMIVKVSPWPFSFITKALKAQVTKGFTDPEIQSGLAYIQSMLGDKAWFNGETLGYTDFIVSWPLDVIAQRNYADLAEYPKLLAWRERVLEREAWKAALEKGNGYDLTTW
ncbi:hypothetical protein BP6252_00395 [Coleophoma cylindrospora]|uniref:Glutathione S-transferase n=1 Tax=Coleophoma cylindrospora TaxID=1849047 RepID=A0A3D8SPW3_9HELO|nr:hypothetical protein BP6252_00395 [Coleophoma cylindrospora]